MNKYHKNLSILFSTFALIMGFQAQAGTTFCLGVSPGNWSDASSWICDTGSGIPETDTNVQIANSIILDVDATILSIAIDPAGDLDVASSAGGLTLQVNSNDVDLQNVQVDLSGNLTIIANNSAGQDIRLGAVNGPHDLNLVAAAQIEMFSPLGGTLPLNSLTTDSGSVMTLFDDITTTSDQTYNNDIRLETSTTLTGGVMTFNGNVYSNSDTTGYDLLLDGDVVFNQNLGFGTLTQASRGDTLNLNDLTVTGSTSINSNASATIKTDGAQEYLDNMTITADTTFESTSGGNLLFWGDIDATGQHLNFNTSGTTQFTDPIFLGDVIIQAASVTTDAGGVTVVQFRADFQVNSDDTATTFNDRVRLGPSTYMEVNQSGAADTVFNDELFQFSGGQKFLTVNDVSGQTIFNGDVLLGQLNTNDGTGNDSTVFNSASIVLRQDGSNDGVMNLNDPLFIAQDVTIEEQNNGALNFNNTLDEAAGAVDVNVVINSDHNVVLGPIGTISTPYTLTTDAGGSNTLNGNVSAGFNVTFNDDVTLNQATTISSEGISLNGDVNLQTFDLSFTAIAVVVEGVISGSGGLISTLDDDLDLRGENTYTGPTIINNGDLSLASSPSLNNISGSSEIFLSSNSTLLPPGFSFLFELADGQVLTGDGDAFLGFQASTGSTISPGSSPGVLSFDALTMETGSTIVSEINGINPGTDYDQLSIANGIELDNDSLGGATLSIEVNTTIQATDEFTVINNTGADPIFSTFNGLPEGATVTANDGSQFSISYLGGDGNDVVLSGLCSGVITVTDAADSGAGTLRQAVLDVCPGGTINFASDMTINLSSAIALDQSVTIDGSAQSVVLSGGGANRIFTVDAGVDVNLFTLNINNGFSTEEGGAIRNAGNLTITDSTFDGNVSNSGPFGGGAIHSNSTAVLNISESTFTNNLAARGGAIFNGNGTMNISISTFVQNGSNANEGGAIHNRGTFVSTNNTMAANGDNSTLGGGLMTWNGNHTLNNTLIADNNGQQDCYIELSNSSQTNSNSLIESGNCDAALTDDPQLQPLANNGGNTLTMALALTSPAVDAGSDALCTVEDQRGVARPQLEACDIGAYETEYLGIIHVDQNSLMRSGTCFLGACWQNAYDNLQDALEVAGSGSQIWVAAGVYLPDVGAGVTGDDPFETFEVVSGVEVYGGFTGTEIQLDQRDFNNNLTVLSGDIDENDTDANGDGVIEFVGDINGTNAHNVITASAGGLVIDGFTITAGLGNGAPPPARRGAAIFCNGSGGQMLSNNTFQANSADTQGGAIYACNGTISDSVFINNVSNGSGGAAGFTSSATPTLTNVSFINNTAANNGGAIQHQGINMDRIAFIGNAAANNGGAMYASNVATLSNTLFSGNAAGSDGGAVYLLAGNNFTNVTMTGNVANSDGGALYVLSAPVRGNNTNIQNTIVWNNEDSSGVGTVGASVSGGGDVIWSNSLIQGSGGSTSWNGAAGADDGNNIDLDPEFILDVILADVPTEFGNARLTLNSVAIGAGDNTAVNTTEDLDGNTRIDGGNVDMGAYEYSDLIFADGFEPGSGND